MITASKAELAKQCPGAFALPHSDIRTADAEDGIARHKVWEDAIGAGDIPEELDERWPGFSWRAEVPFALDIATGLGRELPKGDGHRDYTMANTFEVCGTADVVGLSPDKRKLVIVDRKSFDEVPRASVNLQTGIAATSLARAYGVEDAEVGIYYEARPFDLAQLDAFDLDAFAVRIGDIVRKTVGSKELNEGAWCKHCPAFGSCPIKRRLAVELQADDAADRIEMLLPLSDDDAAARLYVFADRVRMLLKRADAILAARAKERPIPLLNGKVYGLRKALGNTKVDGDIAFRVLLELHGEKVANDAVKRVATQDGIEEAIRKIAGKGQLTTMKAKAMAAIKDAGGAPRAETMKLDEHAPQLASGVK